MHTLLSLRGQEIALHEVDDLAGCALGVFAVFLINISLVWILNIPIHSKENVNKMSFVTRCVGGKEFPMSKPGSEHRDSVLFH